MRAAPAAALLALALPAAAEAQARRDHCASATTTQQMVQCSGAELRDAEGRLAQAVRAAGTRQDAAGRTRLQAAQRAWTAFRDAHCAYDEADSMGGTLHPVSLALCKARLTDERARQLAPRAR